jgi:hypothetical protein
MGGGAYRATLPGVSEKVIALWDQRPIRLAIGALAAVVLVLGAISFVQSRERKPVNYSGGSPFTAPNETALYGRKVPLPAEARTVARTFLSEAVLRKDPLSARKLVSPKLRAAASAADWASGTIPVPQFPAKVFAGAAYDVLRSRQRDVLMDVQIGSTKPNSIKGYDLLVELRPFSGHWLVVSAAPRNSTPVPSA